MPHYGLHNQPISSLQNPNRMSWFYVSSEKYFVIHRITLIYEYLSLRLDFSRVSLQQYNVHRVFYN